MKRHAYRTMDGCLSEDESRIIKRRFMLLDYFGDLGDVDTSSFGDIPTSGISNSFVGPTLEGPTEISSNVDSLIPYAATATPNPSLSSTPYGLSSTGGAALNTVSANPTVFSTGSQGTVQSLSALSSSIAQWGFGLASAFGGTQAQPQTRTIVVGSSSASSNKNLMLFGVLIVAVVLVVVLVED